MEVVIFFWCDIWDVVAQMTLCQFVRRAEPFLDHGEPIFLLGVEKQMFVTGIAC